MPGLKRLGLIILVLFGPGLLIYILAKTLTNKFIELPYIGEHTYVINGDKTDTVYYKVPDFEFKSIEGKTINSESTKGQFLIFTTIQNSCPDTCGLYFFHLDELFYQKLKKNRDNYFNVKIISILTDENGNPLQKASEKLVEALSTIERDSDIWEVVTGDIDPIYGFKFNDQTFKDLPSTASNYEIGTKAFVNSLLLVDRAKHIRGFTGAKRDSDIRNFFDLLKILKKLEFDENRKSK